MFGLGSITGKLDDRCRTIKHLPAAVKYKMVMGGDEGKGGLTE